MSIMRNVIISLFLIVLSIAIVSCEAEVKPTTVQVHLNLQTKEKALLVADNSEIVKYTYITEPLFDSPYLTGETGGYVMLGTDSSGPMNIGMMSQGHWHIGVRGLNSNGKVIAGGETDCYIQASSENIIPVFLVTKDVETGTVSFSVNVPVVSASGTTLLVRYRKAGTDAFIEKSTGWSATGNEHNRTLSGVFTGLTTGSWEFHFICLDAGVFLGSASISAAVVPYEVTTITGSLATQKEMPVTISVESPGYVEGSLTGVATTGTGRNQTATIPCSTTAKTFRWTSSSDATAEPTYFIWAMDGVINTTNHTNSYQFTPSSYGEHQLSVIGLRIVGGVEKEVGSATLRIVIPTRTVNITFLSNGGTFADGTTSMVISQDTYVEKILPGGTAEYDNYNPTRAGYLFVGWVTSGASPVSVVSYNPLNGVTTINSSYITNTDRTLSAVWKRLEYNPTIYWGRNVKVSNAAKPETEVKSNIQYGTTLSFLPAASNVKRVGYTFKGFTTEASMAGDTLTAASIYSYFDDISIHANWEPVPVTVSLWYYASNFSGGSTTPDKTITTAIEMPYGPLPAPIRQGYVFKGWAQSSDIAKLDAQGCIRSGQTITYVTPQTVCTNPANHSLIAVWGEGDIQITFNMCATWPSGEPAAVTAAKALVLKRALGNQYGTLPFATGGNTLRTGYEFAGWYDTPAYLMQVYAGSVVADTNDHQLYAKWIGQQCTVSYNTNSGSTVTTPASKTVRFGDLYGELPQLVRPGYTFLGWKYSGAYKTAESTVETYQNHTLVAQWEKKTSRIVFDPQGGTMAATDRSVLYQNTYSTAYLTSDSSRTAIGLPTPTRTGYTYNNWHTSLTPAGDTVVTGSTVNNFYSTQTLYAWWIAKTFPLTLYSNYGSNAVVATGTLTYGSTYGAAISTGSLPSPERTGYNFGGWYLNAACTGSKILDRTAVDSEGSKNLYAKWSLIGVTISFNSNGGNIVDPILRQWNTNYGTLVSPTRVGYTFTGWHKNAALTDAAIKSTDKMTAVNDFTLYASWTANNYNVTFDSDGGSACSQITVTFDSPYNALPVSTKPGHSLTGWYKGTSLIQNASICTTAGNHQLKAQWSANMYLVTLDSQGGSQCDNLYVVYNSNYGEMPIPVKSGFAFMGWYTNTSYTTQITSGTLLTTASNHTLYAKWKESRVQYTMSPETLTKYWKPADYIARFRALVGTGSGYYSALGSVAGVAIAEVRQVSSMSERIVYATGTTNSLSNWTIPRTQHLHIECSARPKNVYANNCTWCGGDGEYKDYCGTCDGDGTVPCSICGGTGTRTCSICGGDGWITVEEELLVTPSMPIYEWVPDENGDPTQECVGFTDPVYQTVYSDVPCPQTQSCPTTQICGSCDGEGSWIVDCGTCGATGIGTGRSTNWGNLVITYDGATIGAGDRQVSKGKKLSITVTSASTSAPSGYPRYMAGESIQPSWRITDVPSDYDETIEFLNSNGGQVSIGDRGGYNGAEFSSLVTSGGTMNYTDLVKYYKYPGYIIRHDITTEGDVVSHQSNGNISAFDASNPRTMTIVDNVGNTVTGTVSQLQWNGSSVSILHSGGMSTWLASDYIRDFQLEVWPLL